MRRRLLAAAFVALLAAAPVQAQEASTIWGGVGWTAGMFAATNISGTCSQVAELDAAGFVVVTEDNCTTLLPMVQAHLLWPVFDFLSVGPGVGVALGEGIVEQVGVSLVFGFTTSDRTMTLGIGVWGEPGASVLQPQFVPGQLAPTGPDGIPLTPAYLRTTNIRTALSFTIELF